MLMMETQVDRKKGRKGSLKQKEEPALYFNSALTGRTKQRELRLAALKAQFCSSERASPELRSNRVRFSTSPTDRLSAMTYYEPTLTSPSRTPLSASPVKDLSARSILKKPKFALRLQGMQSSLAVSRSSESPEKRANSSHMSTLDKIVSELSPLKVMGFRGNIAKCREKTRRFYQEMNRQASMTDEEIREEMEHRAYVQRVIRDKRRQRASSLQGLSRFVHRKRH